MEHCVRRPILLKVRTKSMTSANDCALTEVTPGYLSPSTEAREFTALCDCTLRVTVTVSVSHYWVSNTGTFWLNTTHLYMYVNNEQKAHLVNDSIALPYIRVSDDIPVKKGDIIRFDFSSSYATTSSINKCMGIILEAV